MTERNALKWPDMSRIYVNSVKAEESIKGSVNRDAGEYDSSLSESATTLDGLSSYNTYSYLENSTAAPSVTTEYEEDVDDDELLSWVASGMLPVNTSTTLALNQAYQEILEQFMGRVEGILAQIRERKKVVQKMVDQSYIADPKLRSAQKVPVLMYICPYFRDSAGLCPGLNKEAKKIRENQFFDMLLEPKVKWSKKECTTLQNAVAEMTLQALVLPLQNKRELLKERSTSDDIKVIEAKKIDGLIADLDKHITKLGYLNEMDLFRKSLSFSLDWNEISIHHMDCSRTATECRLAWKNQILPSLLSRNTSAEWPKEELLKLKTVAAKMKFTNWIKIAEKLNTGRTAFQCFEQYQTELNNSLIKSGWTREEEDKLKEVVEQVRIGNYIPWQQVPFFVDGKTRDQCQRHYKQCLDTRCRRGRWHEDEDLLLMKAIEIFGEKDWSRISDFVQTRTDVQCRERWCLTLNSNFVSDPWSKREDATLLLGASTFGVGNWAKIAQLLPGRSSANCKSRYRTLRKNNVQKDQQSTAITISLQEEDTPEMRAKALKETKRRHFNDCRKARVKNFYKQEYGRIPRCTMPTVEVGTFLHSLPESLRILIRDKLVLIQKLYGHMSEISRKKRRSERQHS